MGHPHHHHHRRGFRGRGFGGVTVIDTGPDYLSSDCYRERLPDGSIVWRCPTHELSPEAGGILPTLVTASDARNYIDETDTGYNTLDASIKGSSVNAEFKNAWSATYVGWKAFAMGAHASVGFFDAKAVMEQTDRWVTTLGNFSTQFHALSPSSTVPTMPSPAGQGVPDTQAASFLSGSTGLVVAGAVLAAILVFGPHLHK